MFGISVTLNGRVTLHNIAMISSSIVVTLFFQGDGQGLSTDSDEACAERFATTLAAGGRRIVIAADRYIAAPRPSNRHGAHSPVREQWDESSWRKPG